MGKYYKTHIVKPLPSFYEYESFLRDPWSISPVKRVAWLTYPMLRDIQLQLIAIQVLTKENPKGIIIWERTRGKMYSWVVKKDFKRELNFMGDFNSDTLRKMKLNDGIVNNLRPLDTWAFVVHRSDTPWGSGRDWMGADSSFSSPAIGYWINRELILSGDLGYDFRDYQNKHRLYSRPPNYGFFEDNVQHHAGWHTKEASSVWAKRWKDERS